MLWRRMLRKSLSFASSASRLNGKQPFLTKRQEYQGLGSCKVSRKSLKTKPSSLAPGCKPTPWRAKPLRLKSSRNRRRPTRRRPAQKTWTSASSSYCARAWPRSTESRLTSHRQKKRPRRLSQGLQVWDGSGSLGLSVPTPDARGRARTNPRKA